jgi:hypothetical protein
MPSSFPDNRIAVENVTNKIRGLQASSAPGPDKIGPALLQELASEVAPILTVIYRISPATGDVKDDCCTTNVMPIFKKGSKSGPGNYQPVNITLI